MNVKSLSLTGLAVALLAAAPVAAQQPAPAMQANPAPGCTATPAEVEANKKVAIEFFTGTVDRHSLIDPSYKQHNPAIKKAAEEAHVSDYQQIQQVLTRLFGQEGTGPVRGRGGRGQAAGPRPPAGNQLEIVTANCDIVTIVHKQYRQDPTAAPGTFYEAFTFDAFRVKNGKLVEHWDNGVIAPPAPAGGRGRD
jgi:predicted SnoaL-like aldol condensation-catalyzing enzyme